MLCVIENFFCKMPRYRKRRGDIGLRTKQAQSVRNRRLNRTPEQYLKDNAYSREQVARSRANESAEQRSHRLHANNLRQRRARQRASNTRRNLHQQLMLNRLALTEASCSNFPFEVVFDFKPYPLPMFSDMGEKYQHWDAFKRKGESAGLCCASGKVSFSSLKGPPIPLGTPLAGATFKLKSFLLKIHKFDSGLLNDIWINKNYSQWRWS